MDKLKVLIADDSCVSRRIFSQAVENTGLGTVVHMASNGNIALEWLKQCDIDVVLLDVLMPEKDGIETLKAVKNEYPDIAVIMMSAGGSSSAQVTIEALKLGAIDFILKPVESNQDKSIDKIKNQLQILFAQVKVTKCSMPGNKEDSREQKEESRITAKQNLTDTVEEKLKGGTWNGADIVVIASSTGGPAALEKIFSEFPPDFKKPVLVVQHMPPDFTRVFAQALNTKCHLNVLEGYEGCKVEEGKAIIAPGGLHMTVEATAGSGSIIRLIDTPYVNGVRPAADVLFQSVAKAYYGKNILAVVLTGMGSDGRRGVNEIKNKCKCFCITQSEGSCVVYGMPRSVYDDGLSDEVADLGNISTRIYRIAYSRG